MKSSDGTSDNSCVIESVKIDQEYPESSKKANIMILPLLIEDESLTTRTASVTHEFANDLNIIICRSDDILMYNMHNKKFNIQGARERYIFYKKMDYHVKDMAKLRRQLEEREVDDNQATGDNFFVNSGNNCEEGSFNQQMKQLSSKAKDVKKKLKNDVLAFTTKKDRVIYLQANSGLWVGLTDEYRCSNPFTDGT